MEPDNPQFPHGVPSGTTHKGRNGVPTHHTSNSWYGGCTNCKKDESNNTHPQSFDPALPIGTKRKK